MMHQMRAEYTPAGPAGSVKSWHVVRNDETTALCGIPLEATSPTQGAERWTVDPDRNCHTCGALLLRESPYLPTEHE